MIAMTALTRWNPFEEMEAMQNRFSSFFDRIPVRNGHYASRTIDWAPPIDVIENRDEYLIRVDLPGVSKKDVHVTLDRGELAVSATRSAESLPEGAEYLHSERAYGTFKRTFGLPSNADASHIEAEFKDGVLTVRVAKDEKAKPRMIAVHGD